MCLYPIYIRNKKYTPNKKNSGIAPILKDYRLGYTAVGCGICEECRKKRGNEWKVRLNEEIKHNQDRAVFVTLTLSDDYYNDLHDKTENTSDEVMLTFAIRHFKERVRKTYGHAKKMWLIQEYGEDYDRVHLHGIIWDMNPKEIDKHWKYGFTYCGTDISEKTVNYIVKYCLKTDKKRPNWKPKIWCSPGIGKDYDTQFNTFNGIKTNDIYRTPNGAKVALPIYYRNKIYTEKQREQLWIRTLEKERRYIYGACYSVSTQSELEKWKKALKNMQEYNERCGFGSIPDYWNKKNCNKFNINKFREGLEVTKKSIIFAETKQQDHESTSRIRAQWRQEQENDNIRGYRYDNQKRLQGRFDRPCEETHKRLRNGLLFHEMDRANHRRQGVYTSLQTRELEKTTINNINDYNYVDNRNQWRKSISGGNDSRMPEMDERNADRKRSRNSGIYMGKDTIQRETNGYEVIDIDTGEIYTKIEYTRIKNQLKTVRYEHKKERINRPDGTKAFRHRTKRFVRTVGKEQFTLFS